MVYIIQMKGIEGYCPESHRTHGGWKERNHCVGDRSVLLLYSAQLRYQTASEDWRGVKADVVEKYEL